MKIKPTYVSYEIAKWLKEKEFDVECNSVYVIDWSKENISIKKIYEKILANPEIANLEIAKGNVISTNTNENYISRPEQYQVIEWLRVNHGIWIAVIWYHEDNLVKWNCFVDKIGDFNMLFFLNKLNSPQEAYSAAFDYIKQINLI